MDEEPIFIPSLLTSSRRSVGSNCVAKRQIMSQHQTLDRKSMKRPLCKMGVVAFVLFWIPTASQAFQSSAGRVGGVVNVGLQGRLSGSLPRTSRWNDNNGGVPAEPIINGFRRHRRTTSSRLGATRETDVTPPSSLRGPNGSNDGGAAASSNAADAPDINAMPGGETLDSASVVAATAEATSLLSIDPSEVEIVPLGAPDTEPKASSSSPGDVVDPAASPLEQPAFVKMFRGSANYIANHRNTLAVYHIPGELLEWDGFHDLIDDIALTWLLGMKIVVVMGCRYQIDKRLKREEVDPIRHNSVRVTDIDTLRVVKEEAGFVRFEVERQLARALRLQGGFVSSSNSVDGNVVSGNFYSAQPFGVLDGVDYVYTGFPRRVEVEKIRQVQESNDIVLLTPLGASPSGEVFNVNSESLAATVAGALGASKVIYFSIQGTALRQTASGKIVQNLRLSDARNLLSHHHVKIHRQGFASVESEDAARDIADSPAVVETLLKVGWAMSALERGVKRAHIIAPRNGALLQELYTRDGSGTLISRDLYEGIRRADVNDVAGIYDLIEPLVKQGTLVDRPKSIMEKDILSYYVYTRDNLIVATGQLKRFEGGFAEIGCLVVSKDYRSQGRGDAMLGYLERLCLQCGATKVFVLSTQTMEWFVERGFHEVGVKSLPPSRQATYNEKRRSKIYMKHIDGDRDLDAAELWWNR